LTSRIRGLLLDIEGTTTPISFVYETLFPYARTHVAAFVESSGVDLSGLWTEYEGDIASDKPRWVGPRDRTDGVSYLLWLMSRDRKSTALKAIQGRIWQAGYEAGELRGEVFPDVPPAFSRWRGQGRAISLFSSGSVLAQKLLFSTVPSGDLRPHLSAYFDTTTGPKDEPGSYARIASSLGLPPSEVLFISDSRPEVDAARKAGMDALLSARSGPPPTDSPAIETFDSVFP
jgi:enolase-phosphatase E1